MNLYIFEYFISAVKHFLKCFLRSTFQLVNNDFSKLNFLYNLCFFTLLTFKEGLINLGANRYSITYKLESFLVCIANLIY